MLIGKKVKIKNHGYTKDGEIENIVISVNNELEPVISVELKGGRRVHGSRFPLKNCEIIAVPATKKDKVEESFQPKSRTKLFSVLTEKIRAGDAELIIRRQNISAWKVKSGMATNTVTAIFDEAKQVVVGVR